MVAVCPEAYATNMVYILFIGVKIAGGHLNTIYKLFLYHVHGIPFLRGCDHLDTSLKHTFLDGPKTFKYNLGAVGVRGAGRRGAVGPGWGWGAWGPWGRGETGAVGPWAPWAPCPSRSPYAVFIHFLYTLIY